MDKTVKCFLHGGSHLNVIVGFRGVLRRIVPILPIEDLDQRPFRVTQNVLVQAAIQVTERVEVGGHSEVIVWITDPVLHSQYESGLWQVAAGYVMASAY